MQHFIHFVPISVYDGIERQTISPAAGKIDDAHPGIPFGRSLGPAQEGFFECDAIVVLDDVRNLFHREKGFV